MPGIGEIDVGGHGPGIGEPAIWRAGRRGRPRGAAVGGDAQLQLLRAAGQGRHCPSPPGVREVDAPDRRRCHAGRGDRRPGPARVRGPGEHVLGQHPPGAGAYQLRGADESDIHPGRGAGPCVVRRQRSAHRAAANQRHHQGQHERDRARRMPHALKTPAPAARLPPSGMTLRPCWRPGPTPIRD